MGDVVSSQNGIKQPPQYANQATILPDGDMFVLTLFHIPPDVGELDGAKGGVALDPVGKFVLPLRLGVALSNILLQRVADWEVSKMVSQLRTKDEEIAALKASLESSAQEVQRVHDGGAVLD